jgi:hypothetical protein
MRVGGRECGLGLSRRARIQQKTRHATQLREEPQTESGSFQSEAKKKRSSRKKDRKKKVTLVVDT